MRVREGMREREGMRAREDVRDREDMGASADIRVMTMTVWGRGTHYVMRAWE